MVRRRFELELLPAEDALLPLPFSTLAHGSSHGPTIPAGYTGQQTNLIRFPIHAGNKPAPIQLDLFPDLGGMLL